MNKVEQLGVDSPEYLTPGRKSNFFFFPSSTGSLYSNQREVTTLVLKNVLKI